MGLNRKLIILVVGVVAVVAVVAVLVVPLLLGDFDPPVDVYARPTPSISEEPLDLLPSQVAGFDLFRSGTITTADGGKSATGEYQGGIQRIQITFFRFSSSGVASSYLDEAISNFTDVPGSFISASSGEQHWFTFTDNQESRFYWRKGIWLFVVIAPDEALRNQVVEELPF